MKELLALAILAVILCSVSTAGASSGIGIQITPDSQHSSPGKMVQYTITVHNDNPNAKSVALEVDAGKCNSTWFEWIKTSVSVGAHSVKSLSMKVTPSSHASQGTYNWKVVTTDVSASATLVVQSYDYASVTHVTGKGTFMIDKKAWTTTMADAEQRFSVKSDKHYFCSGEIEGFVSDEYLIEGARGDNANFKQMSAVTDYSKVASGDYLYGSENVKSSFVFGGTGTKFQELYDVDMMDTRHEHLNLHSTGNQRYKSELATINDFGGHFLLVARQSVPGYAYANIRDEFFGNFTVCKHLVFRRPAESISDP